MKTKIIFHPFDRLVMMDCCHSGMESMGRYEGKEKFKVFDEDHNDKRFSGRFSHEDRGKHSDVLKSSLGPRTTVSSMRRKYRSPSVD